MSLTLMYVLNEYPSPTQTFVSAEIETLRARGVTVVIVSSRRGPGLKFDGAHLVLSEVRTAQVVRRLACTPSVWWTVSSAIGATGRWSLPWVFYLGVISQWLAKQGIHPDHVHSHFASRGSVLAGAVASTLSVTSTVTTHASDIYGRGRALRRLVGGSSIITISDYNQRYLASLGLDAEVVRCGVRTSLFDGRVVRDADSDSNRRATIVSVGRLVPKKGHEFLIRALAALPSNGAGARLQIVGDGPLGPELRELANALAPGQVEFMGSRSHAETLALIRGASAFALACVESPDSDMDGIPVAFMEAAAMGVPIVGSIVGGIGELLDESNSWLAKPGDFGGLALAIQGALSNDSGVLAKTDAARARVLEKYTVEVQTDGLLRVIRAVSQRTV